jgi:hypothetical protein
MVGGSRPSLRSARRGGARRAHREACGRERSAGTAPAEDRLLSTRSPPRRRRPRRGLACRARAERALLRDEAVAAAGPRAADAGGARAIPPRARARGGDPEADLPPERGELRRRGLGRGSAVSRARVLDRLRSRGLRHRFAADRGGAEADRRRRRRWVVRARSASPTAISSPATCICGSRSTASSSSIRSCTAIPRRRRCSGRW